jgi:hypothetical protein
MTGGGAAADDAVNWLGETAALVKSDFMIDMAFP